MALAYEFIKQYIDLAQVYVLKLRTLVCQKGLDEQGRPRSNCFFRSSLIRVFPVCYLRNPALITIIVFENSTGLDKQKKIGVKL